MPKPLTLRRSFDLKTRSEEKDGKRTLRFRASSEYPVSRYGEMEVLSHDEGSVRLDRLTGGRGALLINHDPDQRAGAIRSAELVDGQLEVEVELLPASATGGRDYAAEIEVGSLRGVSIGYRIHRLERQETDEEGQVPTVRATDWEPYEVSLTPIPADPTVGIDPEAREDEAAEEGESLNVDDGRNSFALSWRSIPRFQRVQAQKITKTTETRSVASQEPAMPAPTQPGTPAPETRQVEPLALRISKAAESVGLRASDYLASETYEAASEKILADVAKRKVEQPTVTNIDVRADAADKALDAAVDGLTACMIRSGAQKPGTFVTDKETGETFAKSENRGMRCGSAAEVVRRAAIAMGIAGAADWDKATLGGFALGRMQQGIGTLGKRDIGGVTNHTSAMFSNYVLANVMTKFIYNGFASFRATYPMWANMRPVPDFKQVKVGGVDTGNFVQVAESTPMPEIALNEDGYNGQVGLWGSTFSWSYQAFVNDDLGELTRALLRVGMIAQRTVEKEVYRALMADAFTNSVTSSAPLYVIDSTTSAQRFRRDNLDKGIADFLAKKGKAGELLNNSPAFLLAPPTLKTAAEHLLGKVGSLDTSTEAGQMEMSGGVDGDLRAVISPYLRDTTLPGYSDSSYYLVGSPQFLEALTVFTLDGIQSPQVIEFDTGAVASRGWKAIFPFAVSIAPTYGRQKVNAA